jgi:hypothetical protein
MNEDILNMKYPELQIEVATLRERCKQLEHLIALLTSGIPAKSNPLVMYPTDTNKCPRCGIDFSGSSGYNCSRIDCPTKSVSC